MWFRQTLHFLKEAISNMFINSLMTIASLTTVTCCLTLLGIFLLFSINLDYISVQVKAQCEIQAYIDMSYDDEDCRRVERDIKNISNIRSAVLETSKQAMVNYKEMLGEEAIALDGLEDDFLRASVKITLYDIKLLSETASQVLGIQGVTEVSDRRETINNIIQATDLVRHGCLYAMIVLSIASVFIISNTIKLTVNARSREIHIMKYVGATDWFIRWPFVIEGLIVGALGGILSLSILLASYNSLILSIRSFLDLFDLKSLSEVASVLIGLLMIFGSLIGMIGSFISVRKHLKV